MNTTNCSEILNLIPSYIDDILDNEEKDRVAEHIKSCPDCSAEYAFLSSVAKTTANLPNVKISADFHTKLMAKAKAQRAAKQAKRIVLLKRSGAGVAAAAVVALSVVSFGNLNKTNSDIGDQAPVYFASPAPEVAPTPDTYTTTDITSTAPAKANVQDLQENTQPKTQTTYADTDDAVPSGGGSSARIDIEVAPSATEETLASDAAAISEDACFTKAVITLGDTNRDAVMEILSAYEKDEIGYRIPDINRVMRKIAELGIEVYAESCDLGQNYIIVK